MLPLESFVLTYPLAGLAFRHSTKIVNKTVTALLVGRSAPLTIRLYTSRERERLGRREDKLKILRKLLSRLKSRHFAINIEGV